MDEGFETTYNVKKTGNGIYAFVLEGEVIINNQQLSKRDAEGIWETDKINIKANSAAQILLIDIPMQFN